MSKAQVKRFAKVLQGALNDIDYDTERDRPIYSVRSYSGRGMFGKECLSVSHPSSSTVDMVSVLNECLDMLEFQSLKAQVRGSKMDTLGLGYVTYFPSLAM